MLMRAVATVTHRPFIGRKKIYKIRFQYILPEGSEKEPFERVGMCIMAYNKKIPIGIYDTIEMDSVEFPINLIDPDLFIDLAKELIVKERIV